MVRMLVSKTIDIGSSPITTGRYGNRMKPMLMAAKLIGAGLATIALAGAAVGVGLIFAASRYEACEIIFNLVPIGGSIRLHGL